MLRVLKNHAPVTRMQYQFLTPIEIHTAHFLENQFPMACRFSLDPQKIKVDIFEFLSSQYY